jgi:hypothetical protein
MYAYTKKHTNGGRPLYVGTIHGQKITATSREEFQRLAWQAGSAESVSDWRLSANFPAI